MSVWRALGSGCWLKCGRERWSSVKKNVNVTRSFRVLHFLFHAVHGDLISSRLQSSIT